ncbi:hypothetical protein G6F61_004572 [Rhizopus arrhizus]|nr:hypothetical protein G6F61_004572 [Rhizopus arrhizus]
MARPRSDRGRLRHQGVILKKQEGQKIYENLHFREAKEVQGKSIPIGMGEDGDTCPVRTLKLFLEKTNQIRRKLSDEHTLFLVYIVDSKKVSSIKPITMANWIQQMMREAGVNAKYKAHSIRAAASEKAIQKGNTIQSVKKHANWSLNTNIFENFYYKPVGTTSTSTNITNSILTAENQIL